jgi:hypothetical protein
MNRDHGRASRRALRAFAAKLVCAITLGMAQDRKTTFAALNAAVAM